MTVLCDRCKRETDGDAPVYPRADEIRLSELPFIVLAELIFLPDEPAVYFACSESGICYIGQSGRLHQRWQHHPFLGRFQLEKNPFIAWLTVRDSLLRKRLEKDCIARFQPLWNRGGAGFVCSNDAPEEWRHYQATRRRKQAINEAVMYRKGYVLVNDYEEAEIA